jgi:hypothetical protein
MNLRDIILFVVGPYVIYRLILKYLNNKFDIEIGKLERNILYIIIDIIIIIIYNSLIK